MLKEISENFISKRFKIGVMNDKGGVGKTAITQQLSMALKIPIIELDPYGNLSSRLSFVTCFEQGQKVIIEDKACVVDFGGFAHDQEDEIIAELDILVVPFFPTAESVETTYNMIDRLKENDIPIVFIANRVTKKDEKAVISAYSLFSEELEYGADLTYLTDSRTIQTAVNHSFNIIETANQKGIKGQPYKKMASQLSNVIYVINQAIMDSIGEDK